MTTFENSWGIHMREGLAWHIKFRLRGITQKKKIQQD